MKTKVLVLDALVGATGVQEIENIKGVLAEQSDQFLFQVVDLYDHELAKNQIESADKIIISGSPQAVYETKEWMKKLEWRETNFGYLFWCAISCSNTWCTSE